jgi:hypothetical protein
MICSEGTCQQMGAVYVQGRLIIWAAGEKPSPCHDVHIARSPLMIFPPERVTVATAQGPRHLDVHRVDDPAHTAAAVGGPADAHAMPLALAFTQEGSTTTSPSSALTRREGTGYSTRFDFREAYEDAVRNLPPDPDPFPDKLSTVTVEAVGGMYGGIMGMMKMFVRVSSW